MSLGVNDYENVLYYLTNTVHTSKALSVVITLAWDDLALIVKPHTKNAESMSATLSIC